MKKEERKEGRREGGRDGGRLRGWWEWRTHRPVFSLRAHSGSPPIPSYIMFYWHSAKKDRPLFCARIHGHLRGHFYWRNIEEKGKARPSPARTALMTHHLHHTHTHTHTHTLVIIIFTRVTYYPYNKKYLFNKLICF